MLLGACGSVPATHCYTTERLIGSGQRWLGAHRHPQCGAPRPRLQVGMSLVFRVLGYPYPKRGTIAVAVSLQLAQPCYLCQVALARFAAAPYGHIQRQTPRVRQLYDAGLCRGNVPPSCSECRSSSSKQVGCLVVVRVWQQHTSEPCMCMPAAPVPVAIECFPCGAEFSDLLSMTGAPAQGPSTTRCKWAVPHSPVTRALSPFQAGRDLLMTQFSDNRGVQPECGSRGARAAASQTEDIQSH